LDTAFSPFDDQLIASGSEDTTVMVWRIPEGEFEEHQSTPLVTLDGHQRKVGHVLFHPTAANVLASSSSDRTVKLWDVEKGVERQTLEGHQEIIQSITWSYNGSLMATACRDKKLRVFDVRANQIVQEGEGHHGIKGSRIVWLGDLDRLATTGYSRFSDRQIGLWDMRNLSKALKMTSVDSSSGMLMPYYDADTKMLYVAGKGDGNIRYYEFDHDEFFYLSEFKSTTPQRGIAFMPKHSLHIRDCEVARAYRLTNAMVEPVTFVVPRKGGTFQSDIYPPTASKTPALTADAFFAGEDADPILLDLATSAEVMEMTRGRSPSPLPPRKSPVPSAPQQLTPAQREVAKATGQLLEPGDALHSPRSVTPELPKSPVASPVTVPNEEFEEEIRKLREECEQLRKKLAEREARVKFLEDKVRLFFDL
jgi:hypothetical protein